MLELLIILKNVLLIMILFGASIFVHEFGHFWVAKKLGFKIKTFSIGFGKAIFSRMIDGVEWKVAWIPLGGYVALPQMDPTSGNRLEGVEAGEDGASQWVHPWKKICVSVAGAAMNIVFAFVLAAVVWQVGVQVQSEKLNAIVGYVAEDSPAAEAGMEPGDVITRTRIPGESSWKEITNFQRFMIEAALKKEIEVEWKGDAGLQRAIFQTEKTPIGQMIPFIGGTYACRVGSFLPDSPAREGGLMEGDLITHFNEYPVTEAGQFKDLLQEFGDEEIQLLVKRDGEVVQVAFTPRPVTAEEAEAGYGPYMIGVRWNSLVEGHPTPMEQLSEAAFAVGRVLEALTTPKEMTSAAGSLSGPVGIFDALYRMLDFSFMQAVSFIVLINVNLAILNLLPIPILDGGHVIFSLYEWIRGKPVPEKLVIALTNAFLVVFLLIFLAVSTNDIRRTIHLRELLKPLPEQVEEPAAPSETPEPAPATP